MPWIACDKIQNHGRCCKQSAVRLQNATYGLKYSFKGRILHLHKASKYVGDRGIGRLWDIEDGKLSLQSVGDVILSASRTVHACHISTKRKHMLIIKA